jgi:hypothetical protein
MRRLLRLGVSLIVVMLLGVGVHARGAASDSGSLSFEGGFDITDKYYFRGFPQEDRGFIIQPYGQMNISVVESENVAVSPFVGFWTSFHSEKTGADNGNSSWYEADLFAGVDLSFGEFTVSPIFIAYTYPNGAADTILEIGLILSYDDAAMWNHASDFALNPTLGIFKEVDGSDNAYLEAGIDPSIRIKLGNTPMTLSVPIIFGFSLDNYYVAADGSDDTLGLRLDRSECQCSPADRRALWHMEPHRRRGVSAPVCRRAARGQ